MSNAEAYLQDFLDQKDQGILSTHDIEVKSREYARLKSQENNKELVEALMECAEYLELFAAKAGCGVESSAPKSDADAHGVLSALPKYKSLITKHSK